jgi:hypothetical protein
MKTYYVEVGMYVDAEDVEGAKKAFIESIGDDTGRLHIEEVDGE